MPNEPASILLRNARIVLADRTIEAANLLIDNDRIARVADSAETASTSESVIDLTGLTLFPGFIDVHIHGAVGVDTMNATAEGLHQLAVFLARNGITGWLPTLVPGDLTEYQNATNAIEQLIVARSSASHSTAAQIGRAHA